MLLFLMVSSSAINLAFSQAWTIFGDQEYFFGRTISTFADSEQACSIMSAHLVVISNFTTQMFLENTIGNLQGIAAFHETFHSCTQQTANTR